MNRTNVINAWPTKNLFISMLVKDIPLTRSIIDLVDNSVDGARRVKPNGKYEGLWVHVDASSQRFAIRDNCGGIPVDVAQKYAFRFGRPEETDVEETPHSVGQFGVGMKRALFKLGKKFTVESRTKNARFVVEVDVDEWKRKNEWEFAFKELQENLPDVPDNECGTEIIVTPLHESVAGELSLENYIDKLLVEIEAAHEQSMSDGLRLTLNDKPLQNHPVLAKQSNVILPAYRDSMIEQPDQKPVRVAIFAGIDDSDPTEAGWYVYCNGRMLLAADQSYATGWGEVVNATIPRYHNQFARFRGYVFFDSEDSGLLPWNTTKTGVDVDSPLYGHVRRSMIEIMRPVIDFLNDLDRENDPGVEDRPLQTAVSHLKTVPLSNVKPSEGFVTKVDTAPRQRVGNISYSRPIKEIDRVKKALGVSSLKEVGEETFDYYVRMVCDDK